MTDEQDGVCILRASFDLCRESVYIIDTNFILDDQILTALINAVHIASLSVSFFPKSASIPIVSSSTFQKTFRDRSSRIASNDILEAFGRTDSIVCLGGLDVIPVVIALLYGLF